MFVFNTELINRSYTGRTWVTKLNPTKWSGKSEKQRWFQEKEDLEDNLIKGTFDQMLIFRHCGGELPFKKFLKRIVLDDPARTSEEDVDFYSMAVGALKLAMSDSDLDIPIERRVCRLGCKCNDNYGEDDERLYMMFDAKF